MGAAITNTTYCKILVQLKQHYADLPWYQRWWFSLWSWNLSSALEAVDLLNPTVEQVNDLLRCSDEAWFYNDIFNFLTQFREAIGNLGFSPSMQNKDIRTEITERLDFEDILALATISHEGAKLFKPIRDTRKFLLQVVQGEYAQVEASLKNNSEWFLEKGRVTDYSGRTFYNISGFQYYLWALDKHGWTKILHALPQDEKGARIKEGLLKQYQELKEKGVTYKLNGKIIREEHFDFQNTIIQELDNQRFREFDYTWNRLEIDLQWRTGVGSAQKLLPMHVVYEYCSEAPLEPQPTFIGQPTRLTMEFHNKVTQKNENWFHVDSKLGSDFAIFRLSLTDCARGRSAMADGGRGNEADLSAMKALCEIRTRDFQALEQQLKESLAPDNPASQAYFV